MSLGMLRHWTGRRGCSEAQAVKTAQEPPVIRLGKHGELGRVNVATGQSRLSWVPPRLQPFPPGLLSWAVTAFSTWFAQLGLSRPWPGGRKGLGPMMESEIHLRKPCGFNSHPHSTRCQA